MGRKQAVRDSSEAGGRSSGESAQCVALDTIRLGKQALIFNNSKRSAEKTAEDIAKKLKVSAEESANLNELAQKALSALSRPTKQCERLAFCLRKGTAFHHAGLAQKQRELVEDAFRAKTIKIISATPTLAAGVDLPAFRAIIKDVKRFGHDGMQYIYVLEYMQMAGRAGRPKFDSHGEAILLAATEAEKVKLFKHYVLGEPEDIYSKLAVEPVLRTYLLSLIAADFLRTKKHIIDFFAMTFWAHQFRDMMQLEGIIDKMLKLLEEYEFIKSNKESNKAEIGSESSAPEDGFTSAHELATANGKSALSQIESSYDYARSKEAYHATQLGKRVAELYIDPLTAHNFIVSMKKASLLPVPKEARDADSSPIQPFSLLHMVSHTLEIRPLLRVKVKEYEDIQQTLLKYSGELLVEEPAMFDLDYDEYLASIKTAQFFNEWVNENDEEFLLEKYGIRPGEIRVKLDTADWLLYSCIELAKLLGLRKVNLELNKMRLRLLYGAKEELLALLRLKNIGRVRARKLFDNGIRDLGDLKKADLAKLSQLLGKAIALDVKEQLGQEILEVPDGKRKGQLSMRKFG
jgi:helicase